MAMYLVLESATELASVALVHDGQVVAEQTVVARNAETGQRTEGLAPAIARVFADADVMPTDVSGVLCSAGPGGFTSLRTGASIAKGVCFALSVPLFAVPTLELIVAGAANENGVYVAALEAGRGEYYARVITHEAGRLDAPQPIHLVSRSGLDELVQSAHATLIGPPFHADGTPNARHATKLLDRVLADGPVDADVWEPIYGRLPEAQVKWEATHGRPLAS